MNNLRDFNYDESIYGLINEIKKDVLKLEPKVKYLILTGSGGRGELSSIRIHNRLKLLSDLEFFAVLEGDFKLNKFKRKNIQKKIKQKYAQSEVKTLFFHVDIDFVSEDDFVKQDTLLAYETISNSCIVYGKEEVFNMEIVNVNERDDSFKIDIKDIHNIILYRHYAILNSIQFEENELTRTSNLYAICRNSLDLLTVILYYNNIKISSYEDRKNFLSNCENADKIKKCKKIYCDKEFVSFIDNCFQFKMKTFIPENNKVFYDFLKKYNYYSNEVMKTLLIEFHNSNEKQFFKRSMGSIKKVVWSFYYWIFVNKLKTFNINRIITLNTHEKVFSAIDKTLINLEGKQSKENKKQIRELIDIYKSKFPYSVN